MKNLSIYLFAFLALALSMTSCKKDKDLDQQMDEVNDINDDPTSNEVYFFSYNINGETTMSEGIMAYGINDVDDGVVRAYGVLPGFEDGMYVEIPKGSGNGTYAIHDSVFGILTVDGKAYSTYHGPEQIGEITLNFESETILSGVFNFRLWDTDNPGEFLDVTDGKFRVAYRD